MIKIQNSKQNRKLTSIVVVTVILISLLFNSGPITLLESTASKNVILFNMSSEESLITRVNLMPNIPSPFQMRDWKQVARDYDAFIFNFSKTGEYLPLIHLDSSYVNFHRDTFNLPSYVGTSIADEAINCMAAVLSATLVGIDKSNQSGYNWVEMCENWYNIDSGEYIYLNNRYARSDTSFWYVLFPNLIFYQLAYYYPETADFQNEMRGVADRWYEACIGMGGDNDPWTIPNFDYTAFDFSTMKPVYNGKWKEPDSAAAIAWLEYMAYLKWRNSKYLIATDWCLEYLEGLNFNPLYEILLPYGAYIAARVNAEYGRDYNINKIINWCFGPADARFGWGIITENWNGFDCHGLHGSITDGGGYAFAMGTYDNVGCLVPIVRYNDSYAHAIGKYTLNAANAARLFFGNSLNADHQDSEDWIAAYDPNYCIGYEGLRKIWNGISPLATGDVNRDRYINQNGATNLGLYGSSHVGILGGIISPTNNEKILKLDCLVTDYYHDEAYPTYLYYNPYNDVKNIEIDVGPDPKSLYDTTTDSFILTGVSGLTSFQLPSDSAAVIVLVPSDGFISYNNNKTLVNNVIVDFDNNNKSVVIDSFTTVPEVSDSSTTKSVATTSGFDFFMQFISLAMIVFVIVGSRKKKK